MVLYDLLLSDMVLSELKSPTADGKISFNMVKAL